jgi:hypothetical protein
MYKNNSKVKEIKHGFEAYEKIKKIDLIQKVCFITAYNVKH